jgi:hypothetical protein
MQEKCIYGGGCFIEDINKLMLDNAKKNSLNYSHKKGNRWNMWLTDSGLTLSFTLNKGLFIPSISGQRRKTLEKFYSTCPSDVDGWVKSHIKTYLSELKDVLTHPEPPKEVQEVQTLIKQRKAKKQASKQIEGQLSIFDMEGFKR